MRTVLAAAAAGALIMGSAAGAMAAKPEAKPAPQTTVKLQSVSIKGHKTIDLATATPATAIRLRAKLWDPKKLSAATTVAVTMGVYTKKVDGDLFNLGTTEAPLLAPLSEVTPLLLKDGDATRKVKNYSATPLVLGAAPALWTAEELGLLAAALEPGEKAFICISAVTVNPDVKKSMQVKKRLDLAKGKAVRDCVKVIDSKVDTPPVVVP